MSFVPSASAVLPAPVLFHVLIPCAGRGERAAAGGPKQFRHLAGRMLVEHTLAAFLALEQRLTAAAPPLPNALMGTLALVLAPGMALPPLPEALAQRTAVWPVGGAVRAASVLNGLLELGRHGAADDDWVLVHDAARCLIQPELIERLLQACWNDAVGGLLALPLPDTLKAVAPGSPARAAATLTRADKWLAQTPQMFRLGVLRTALAAHRPGGFVDITDEASAIERTGRQPLLVEGSARNFKLTHPQDFALAEALLQAPAGAPAAAPAQTSGREPESASRSDDPCALADTQSRPTLMRDLPELRIGEGWDVHPLVAGRPLVLGGVPIPHPKGLLGHSDADALLHAITDALLGAAALGDIGTLFPDTDARFAGADSAVLLAQAAQRVAQQGWVLRNVDSTIVAQEPKMAPYKAAMQARIAALLGLQAGQVNVKAKTAERLGPVGEGRAIECRAVVLLQRG